MKLSKSDPIFDFKEWTKLAKEQEEQDGFLMPEPLIKEVLAHPDDFIFRREEWTVIVEWKGRETMYFPIMEGKHARR